MYATGSQVHMQETVRCFAAMLGMGAEEGGSPAASQLERHVNQFVRVRPSLLSLALSAAAFDKGSYYAILVSWAVAHAGLRNRTAIS